MPLRAMERLVLPEILDELPPDDPRAQRSRRDLRRIHRVMRSASILRRAFGRMPSPRRIIELGAGDGTLLLRLARRLDPPWKAVELTLLDRHDLLAAPTRAAYGRLGWKVEVLVADVFDWARAAPSAPADRHDLCVANLFLHHFRDAELKLLLAGVAARADAFVACEPRRDALALLAGRSTVLIGANAVTRSDAVTSVAAGFRDRELTEAWCGTPGAWRLEEFRALPFTHCFVAQRARGSAGAGRDSAERPGG